MSAPESEQLPKDLKREARNAKLRDYQKRPEVKAARNAKLKQQRAEARSKREADPEFAEKKAAARRQRLTDPNARKREADARTKRFNRDLAKGLYDPKSKHYKRRTVICVDCRCDFWWDEQFDKGLTRTSSKRQINPTTMREERVLKTAFVCRDCQAEYDNVETKLPNGHDQLEMEECGSAAAAMVVFIEQGRSLAFHNLDAGVSRLSKSMSPVALAWAAVERLRTCEPQSSGPEPLEFLALPTKEEVARFMKRTAAKLHDPELHEKNLEKIRAEVLAEYTRQEQASKRYAIRKAKQRETEEQNEARRRHPRAAALKALQDVQVKWIGYSLPLVGQSPEVRVATWVAYLGCWSCTLTAMPDGAVFMLRHGNSQTPFTDRETAAQFGHDWLVSQVKNDIKHDNF